LVGGWGGGVGGWERVFQDANLASGDKHITESAEISRVGPHQVRKKGGKSEPGAQIL